MKDFTKAIADYTKALKLDPRPHLYLDRGRLLYQQKNFFKALKDLSTAIDKAKNFMAYYFRGFIYYKQKKYSLAIADWKIFLKLAPDIPKAQQIRSLLRRKFNFKQKDQK